MNVCTPLNQYGPLVGRILLVLIFILSGYGKLTGWDGTLGFMASKGIPLTSLFLALTIAVELGGGLLIALGLYARWAALAIFLFLIPVTLIFHPFWSDPSQMNTFMKNIAIMGGMLYIMTYGSGPYSIKQEKCP
ncbi:MAG: DoxX family protein [Gammaproteobacteria bacterium]|nr:DoxX family protein [Gammaproteobacteria bacterium]